MDKNLFHHPFLYMTGHGDIRLTNAERLRLRKYLIGGGFLWADDNYGLDQSLRRELRSLFPENPLVELPSTHPLYSSSINFRGCRKFTNMMENRQKGWVYSLREDWWFSTRTALTSGMEWKIYMCIMMVSSFMNSL
jgi:hypothetical protein